MNARTLSYLERGEIAPKTVDILVRLAAYFNVSVDYLLGVTDDRRTVADLLTMQETLSAVSEQGLQLLAMYEALPADDQAVVVSMVRRMDEQRKSIENLRVALELVDLAGRLGGEAARAVALGIMDGDLTLDEALTKLGK